MIQDKISKTLMQIAAFVWSRSEGKQVPKACHFVW
jgi:hypothetical protein